MNLEPEQLTAFLENSIRQETGWTAEVIRTLTCDDLYVVNLLKGILRSGSSIKQVAISSYKHLNGFDKIVLASFGREQCKLRLHVWWGDCGSETFENVHNHRWDFSASILFGNYRFQMYEVGEGQKFYEYEYHAPKDDGYYVMKLASQVSARCVCDAQLFRGTRYHLSHITLHRVSTPANQTVVTLMCQAPAVSIASRVFSEELIPNAQHVLIDRMSEAEVKAKLERVIATLESVAE